MKMNLGQNGSGWLDPNPKLHSLTIQSIGPSLDLGQ